MVLLENDQFLSRLTLMFDKSRSKGHVDLSMKRYDGRTKPIPREDEPVKGDKGGNKSSKSTNNPRLASSSSSKSRTSSTSEPGSGDYMCLVRATYMKEKISTVVHSRDVNKFQMAYCNVLKSNMDGLKRQKKTKLKKTQ